MKKNNNKFILTIIILIISILSFEVYQKYFALKVDRNSYISLIQGKALLNNYNLGIQEEHKLKAGDKVNTIGEKSLAVIRWGDGSITRIGGNSELIVNKTEINDDLSTIKIDFELKSGKTWSNVVSFVGGKSYFYEKFSDTTAAVRGTIFEVNLKKDYLYVESHEVILKKGKTKKIIPEKKPFVISKFSFVQLMKYISYLKDKTWQELNRNLDKKFYKEFLSKIKDLNIEDLSTNINELIKKIPNASPEEKAKLYNELKSQYQKLNFLKPDSNLFKEKLEVKKILIDLAPKDEKLDLLTTSIYDFNDIMKSKQYIYLKENIFILKDHLFELKNLDIDFNNYFQLNSIHKIEIPKGLEEEFVRSFKEIGEVLNLGDIDLTKNKVVEYFSIAKKQVEKTIDKNLLNKIIDFIKEIFK